MTWPFAEPLRRPAWSLLRRTAEVRASDCGNHSPRSAIKLAPQSTGRKVSDKFTVPVCRLHHRELHRQGDEAAWWTGVKIDPVPIALALWRSTHRDGAFSPAGGGRQHKVA